MHPALTWFGSRLLKGLRVVLRHPRAFGIGWIVLTLGLGAMLPRLRTLLTINDLLDETFPTRARFQENRDRFDIGNTLLVIFSPRSGQPLTDADLCRVNAWLQRTSLREAGLQGISSPFEVRRPVESDGRLLYLPLIPLHCDPPSNARAQLEALAESPWARLLSNQSRTDLAVELVFQDTQSARHGNFDPRPVGEVLADLEREFPDSSRVGYRL